MKKQRLDNGNNAIICHWNINLFRNKFGFVNDITKLFHAFLISISQVDHTFLSNQFRKNGYKIVRLDHNCFGGGLILHINEDISCKPLQEYVLLSNFAVTVIKFYQNSQQWLLLGLYNKVWNNTQSSDMAKLICQLIGHEFPQFQLCPVILWTKNQKSFSSFLGF